MNRHRRLAMAILPLVVMTAGACSRADARKDTPPPASDWDTFRDGFMNTEFDLFPDLAVYVGRHEFDGKLPDWSAAGLSRTTASLHSMRDAATAFADAALDAPRRFERDYIVGVLDQQLFWIERADAPHTNPDFYVSGNPAGPALSPDVYVTRPYAPIANRLRAYITWAKAVPGAVAQIQANLHPPLKRPFIDVGRLRFGGLAAYLRDDIPAAFADAKEPALQAEFREANAAAANAFSDFDAWLESQRKTQTDTFALGADRFAEMLRQTERVDVPLERLTQLGRDDMSRNVAALREACGRFAPGAALPQCVERMGMHKPKGSVVAEGAEQVRALGIHTDVFPPRRRNSGRAPATSH